MPDSVQPNSSHRQNFGTALPVALGWGQAEFPNYDTRSKCFQYRSSNWDFCFCHFPVQTSCILLGTSGRCSWPGNMFQYLGILHNNCELDHYNGHCCVDFANLDL